MSADDVRQGLARVGLSVSAPDENRLLGTWLGLHVSATRDDCGWRVRTHFDRGELHRDGDALAPRRLPKQLVKYIQTTARAS